MARAFLLLAVVLALAMPGTAAAQASPDRPGRVAPGLASSTCIGDTRSPVCAAETLLACLARAEAELCRRAGVADPRSAAAHPPMLIEYTIDRTTIIKREDITEDLKDVDWYKPGYALIEVRRRDCAVGSPNCAAESWTDLQIYARPRGNAWDIVTWRGDTDEEAPPDIPDAFKQAPPPAPPARR